MPASKTFVVQYFSVLQDQAGLPEERIEADCSTPADLYAWVSSRHGFALPQSSLGVAVNGDWGKWDAPLSDGDLVVFIPPVSGG